MSEPDAVRPSAPQPAMSDHGELRHTLTVEEVGVALSEAGVPRSRRQIIRYCQTELLDAVKVPGPTGDQWYVSPASLPKAIGDLKLWEAQRERQSPTEPDMSGSVHPMSDLVQPEEPLNSNPDAARQGAPKHAVSDLEISEEGGETQRDTARHGEPEPAASDLETKGKGGSTEPDTARHGPTDLDIYEHPYVKKLEDRVDKLEAKYEAQVRRTEEIQIKSQQQLLELQRMTAVGQSQTLADFMLKAREWVLGQAEPDKREEGGRVDNSTRPA